MFKRRAQRRLMMDAVAKVFESFDVIVAANAGPATRDHESDGPSSGDFAEWIARKRCAQAALRRS